MYVKAGSDDKALPIFNQIISLNPENLGAMNNLGAIYRRKKDYDSSVAILQKARELYEDNSQVEYNLGFTYKIMGEYDKAIKCFEDVIEENPTDVLAYNHIGAIYAERGQHENAVQSYLRALKIDPNHPVLHLNIAKSYEKLKKNEEALREYENALRSKPGWLEAIDAYADLLMKERKSKDAGALVMQAIRLNPQDLKMHSKLGNILEKQGDTESAIDEYSQALEIKGDYAPALSGLASSYEKQGNLPAALHTMEKLESVKPNDAAVLQQYSGILLSAKKTDEAKKKIDTLMDIAQDDPHALNLLGQYHICNGDFDNAKSCFDKIEELYPAFKEYLKDGAKRMKQQGVFDEAETLQKQYLALHPEDPESLSFLAGLYEEQNKISDALELYQRSLDAFSDNVEYVQSVERLQNRIKAENAEESAPIYDSIADVEKAQEREAEPLAEEIAAEPEIPEEPQEAADEMPVYIEKESIPTLESLAKEDDKDVDLADIFNSTADVNTESVNATDNSSESISDSTDDIFDTSIDESAPNTPSGTIIIGNIPRIHSVNEDIAKSIDEIVPLDDITDYDFSGMNHDMVPDENLAWSLHSTEIDTAKEEAAEEPKSDIDSAWDNSDVEPSEKFDYFNDFNDIAADDFSEAVDMTPPPPQADLSEQPEAAATKQPETAEMLEKMRDILAFLPAEKKEQFLESKARIRLEYVISKLRNHGGLLQKATKIRNAMGLSTETNGDAVSKDEIKGVLNYMMSMSQSLEDKTLAAALNREGQQLIEKL